MSGPHESGNRKDRLSHKPKSKRPKTDEEKKAEGAKGRFIIVGFLYS